MGYQKSISLTKEEKQFIIDNANSMTILELSEAMGLTKSRVQQAIRLMDLNKKQVTHNEEFFNVYEYENWIA